MNDVKIGARGNCHLSVEGPEEPWQVSELRNEVHIGSRVAGTPGCRSGSKETWGQTLLSKGQGEAFLLKGGRYLLYCESARQISCTPHPHSQSSSSNPLTCELSGRGWCPPELWLVLGSRPSLPRQGGSAAGEEVLAPICSHESIVAC